MKSMNAEIFLAWAAEAGIGPDQRFNESRELVFHCGESHSCYWTIPPEIEGAKELFRLLLEMVWGAGDMAVWPRDGNWWTYQERLEKLGPESPFAKVISSTEKPAVFVGRSEMPELIKFMVFAAEEGWRLSDDIHLVLPDRSCILMLSHHQTLHASAVDLKILKKIVEHLEQGGFPLSEDKPDWTFKHPGLIREAD